MKKEYIDSLIEEYLAVAPLSDNQKAKVVKLNDLFIDNVEFLYDAYHSLKTGNEETITSKGGQLFLEKEGNQFILRDASTGIFAGKEELMDLLIDLIAIDEEILPLGTVVDLKKEAFSEDLQLDGLEQFRVVITKRFLGVGDKCYYPYGTLLYPYGTIGNGKSLSVTPLVIESVVHRGFSDELDDVFVYKMKHAIICEQRRKSVGFASKEELAQMQMVVDNIAKSRVTE